MRLVFAASLVIAALSSGSATADDAAAPNSAVSIAGRSDVQAALAVIHADVSLRIGDMISLTEIAAPTSDEGARAAAFAEMLRAAGIADVQIDAAGNVVGRRPGIGGGPTIALLAHLDTVFPAGTDLRVHVEGDIYRAPGIGDHSSGLAYLLALAHALTAAHIETRGDILLVATVGEEAGGHLRGAKYLFRPGGPRIDMAIAIEPGDAAEVGNVAIGAVRYRLTISGLGGHSWDGFGLANPVDALGNIIARFQYAASQVAQAGPAASFNVGRIGGGNAVTSVPADAWMEVDIRSVDPDTIAMLDNALHAAALDGLARENVWRGQGPPLAVNWQEIGARPCGSTSEKGPLVRAVVAAIESRGVRPAFVPSSSDANVPMSLGIPAVRLGAGGISEGTHSLRESWRSENSDLGPEVGLLTVLPLVGMAN